MAGQELCQVRHDGSGGPHQAVEDVVQGGLDSSTVSATTVQPDRRRGY